ncbi:unnamed protein product [Protopolystoma xenopodis]|uniref:Uncharacterized protein n=1 Tax=Protopolystoma xenopodis TaxID=117903 RepID=A0A448WI73_9PLAT|nr:unnamed protein product [Protopolystoma xenopodis]
MPYSLTTTDSSDEVDDDGFVTTAFPASPLTSSYPALKPPMAEPRPENLALTFGSSLDSPRPPNTRPHQRMSATQLLRPLQAASPGVGPRVQSCRLCSAKTDTSPSGAKDGRESRQQRCTYWHPLNPAIGLRPSRLNRYQTRYWPRDCRTALTAASEPAANRTLGDTSATVPSSSAYAASSSLLTRSESSVSSYSPQLLVPTVCCCSLDWHTGEPLTANQASRRSRSCLASGSEQQRSRPNQDVFQAGLTRRRPSSSRQIRFGASRTRVSS